MSADIILYSSSKDDLKSLISETIKEELKMFFKKENEPDNRMLTRKEVSAMLGVSLVTLSNWVKEGIVPAVRLNSSVRFRMADIESAMKEIKSIKYLRGRTIKNVQL